MWIKPVSPDHFSWPTSLRFCHGTATGHSDDGLCLSRLTSAAEAQLLPRAAQFALPTMSIPSHGVQFPGGALVVSPSSVATCPCCRLSSLEGQRRCSREGKPAS
ncbi:hypothetical protein VPH35_094654 [Triticum aestivum]